MVNQNIYNYLKQYKDQYPLEALKKKILSKGYPEAEYDLALAAIKGGEPIKPAGKPTKPTTPTKLERSEEAKTKGKGLRWMKFSGLIGMLLLLFNLSIAVFIITGINIDFQGIFGNLSTGVIIGMISVYLIFSLLYLFGFIKMGQKFDSKIIRVAGWLNFGFLLILTFYIGTLFMIGNAPTSIESVQSGTTIFITLALILFIGLIARYLLSLALIKNGPSLEYSKAAGILDLIVAIIFTGIILVGVYSIMNPAAALGIGLSLFTGGGTWAIYASIIFYSLKLAALFFESMTFFKAAAKPQGAVY